MGVGLLLHAFNHVPGLLAGEGAQGTGTKQRAAKITPFLQPRQQRLFVVFGIPEFDVLLCRPGLDDRFSLLGFVYFRREKLQEVALVVVHYRHQGRQAPFLLPDHYAVLLGNCGQLFIRLVSLKGNVAKGLVPAREQRQSAR